MVIDSGREWLGDITRLSSHQKSSKTFPDLDTIFLTIFYIFGEVLPEA